MRKTCRVILTITLTLMCGAAIIAQDAKLVERERKEREKRGAKERKIRDRFGVRFESEYDRFKDETRIETSELWLFPPDVNTSDPGDSYGLARFATGISVKMYAVIRHKGRAMTEAIQDADLVFTSKSKEWVFIDNHSIVILADGKRIGFDKVTYDGDVLDYGVAENMIVTITAGQLAQIASAKSVLTSSPTEVQL